MEDDFVVTEFTPAEIRTLRRLRVPGFLRNGWPSAFQTQARMARFPLKTSGILSRLYEFCTPPRLVIPEGARLFRGETQVETLAVVMGNAYLVHRPRAGTRWCVGNFPETTHTRRFHALQILRAVSLLLRPNQPRWDKGLPSMWIPHFRRRLDRSQSSCRHHTEENPTSDTKEDEFPSKQVPRNLDFRNDEALSISNAPLDHPLRWPRDWRPIVPGQTRP